MIRTRTAAASLVALLVGACSPTPADDGVRVVASLYPVAAVAEAVVGPAGAVTDLTPSGGEPHDLELTARQVVAISEADLVVYIGGGLQPSVEDAIRTSDAPTVDLLDAAGAAGPPDDPHVWLDPLGMVIATVAVSEALGDVDPERRSDYRARAERFIGELQRLHRSYRSGLEGCATRTIITTHEAFGHLAARYGLEQYALSGVDPESEPSSERLEGVREVAESTGATTVFAESLGSEETAVTVAEAAGLEVAVLDPIELRPETGDYFDAMERNLAALRDALRCG